MVKMACQVGMALMVAVALPVLKVLPVRRVSVALLGLRVRRVLPVLTAGMVKTVRMGARWCLCTVPGAVWL